eukprot:CAMPEP_0181081452 /NCGR_PEP_ID=MMETSP1071-20121207/3108_1 /TAXON_ID=35127 /ORGANISM="Thalassiosira sp., Strain NH16" /LENGTH=444 /DNA_ID=CAMNT_0023162997 /DNA_START=694 /DNA_END=2028 /DNA_ORIENTATION=+
MLPDGVWSDWIRQNVLSVCAYGQTGSGKTYSVFGPPGVLTETELQRAQSEGKLVPDTWGIFPRVAIQLFNLPQVQSFQVSVIEVYQNRAFDLLDQHKVLSVGSTRSSGTDLGNGTFHPSGCYCRICHKIRHKQSNQPGRKAEAVLAKREVVKSAEDVARLARLVEISRIAKGHLLNARSSRSHCLIQIHLSLKQGGKVSEPTFLFVDLAGSERIKKSGVIGEASHEATRINSSLTVLGRVIQALANGVKHVPYRESTLTQILQPVFAGRVCASVIVNIASEQDHAEESLGSLRFAKRLTGVKVRESQVEACDPKAKREMIEKELVHARRQLEVMIQQGLGGGILPMADSIEKRSLEENLTKLSTMESHVMNIKMQLKEAHSLKPRSAQCHQLEEKLHKAKSHLEIAQGIVGRQKTIKRLWAEPTLACTKVRSQVQNLESMLAMH